MAKRKSVPRDGTAEARPEKRGNLSNPFRPPIPWQKEERERKQEDYTDYEVIAAGIKTKQRILRFDGESGGPEALLELLQAIHDFVEYAYANNNNFDIHQIKFRQLKQWTSKTAERMVMSLSSSVFHYKGESKPIGLWIQDGDDDAKQMAYDELEARLIHHFCGDRPFDTQRQYLLTTGPPRLTVDSTDEDYRLWSSRFKEINAYLPKLFRAQFPSVDLTKEKDVQFTTRQEREIMISKCDVLIQTALAKRHDNYTMDDLTFQQQLSACRLEVALIRRNSQQTQGGQHQATAQKAAGQNRKFCKRCSRAGRPEHVVKSHKEADCRFKGEGKPKSQRSQAPAKHNQPRPSVNAISGKRTTKKSSGTKRNPVELDDASTSSRSSKSYSSASFDDYPEHHSRKRQRQELLEGEGSHVGTNPTSRHRNYYVSAENETKRTRVTRVKDPTPELMAKVLPKGKKGREVPPECKLARVLIDSGASHTIFLHRFACDKFARRVYKSPETEWSTRGGVFTTTRKADVAFVLPELTSHRIIKAKVFVDTTTAPTDTDYDIIIGRDLLTQLGLILDFQACTITWDGVVASMKERGALSKRKALFNTYQELLEPDSTKEATKRVIGILDAKYEKADLHKLVEACTHLQKGDRDKLLRLLKQYEDLFDGTLGAWKTSPVDFELKPGAKPHQARPFPVPRVHLETVKKELKRLCKIGVLRKIPDDDDGREYQFPTFVIPKKNGTVRLVSDFRKLNEQIKRSPYPIPVIKDILQQLEGFTYATSLDLNMGYYTMRLTPNASRLCTIITPFGKYEYLRLPMGVHSSPDIFQHRMATLMDGLQFVRTYLDDLLLITKGDFSDHLDKLEKVLERLRNAGLKVNAEKSFFGRAELEYLGYWITRDGFQPLPQKVQAIINMKAPQNVRQLRRFIGMINFYRDMWIRRSHILAPLTRLTSKKTKFVWDEAVQKAFEEIKRVVARDVVLAYPDFSQPFEIHTDASKHQLGAVIMQKGRPLAFYSRKLTPAQTRYTTTERELLSIVETLKEFKTILLGQQIIVKTDHKNLTYHDTTSDRVLRWALLMEEFSPRIEYIKGHHNVVADALSRLEIDEDTDSSPPTATAEANAQLFGMSVNEYTFPLAIERLYEAQKKDQDMVKRMDKHPEEYQSKEIEGTMIVHYKNKLYIPSSLREEILNWYHTNLLHPGVTRTTETIRQYMYWPKLDDDVKEHVRTCPQCQKNKLQKKKYGHLPEKQAEANPWQTVCVDLIGPYTLRTKRGKRKLQAMSIIDPATGWLELVAMTDKKAETAGDIFRRTWLTRYPRPRRCIHDNGNEFLGESFANTLQKAGIKPTPTTVRNPQANGVLERVHQVLGNMIRTLEISEDPKKARIHWDDILQPCAWAVRSTYHTGMKATPGQLIYGRDMIHDISFKVNWELIKQTRQERIHESNLRENAKRIAHTYHEGDKVLLKNDANPNLGKLENHYLGPYTIIKVHDNGTVTIDRLTFEERVNIRRIVPFYERRS